jgi:hypothetical protein
MEDEHTACHAYGFDSTNVQRVEVSIPGWREGHESSVWVSEDLLAAVGWRSHCKPHQWPQGFDPRNISALRRMAGHLRVCPASRAKLSLLGTSVCCGRQRFTAAGGRYIYTQSSGPPTLPHAVQRMGVHGQSSASCVAICVQAYAMP